jgi:hypothetical protein
MITGTCQTTPNGGAPCFEGPLGEHCEHSEQLKDHATRGIDGIDGTRQCPPHSA